MIPAEAVEAAAKVMTTQVSGDSVECEMYQADARAVLEAAAPYLMAQAWDEGREADDFEVSIGMDGNPYRKGNNGDD